MTSYETIRFLERFITAIEDKPNLHGLLSVAADQHFRIIRWVPEIVYEADSNKAWNKISELGNRLVTGFAFELKKVGSRKIYGEVEEMLFEIKSLAATYGELFARLAVLDDELNFFIERYETFLHDTSKENVLSIIETAADLKKSLHAYLRLGSTVRVFLDREESFKKEGYAKLSLLLSEETSYKNLLNKLIALDQLYNETCNLLGVSSAEYPLQVAKMEAGSLWLKIFGESKVIALLTRLIESGVAYLYRAFTNEGKIASIPKKVESVEAVLRLSENLQEMGIDTTAVKENLQKSAVLISSHLNDLLAGSPSIKVNDQNFSVGDAVAEKYLTESRRLLIDKGQETDGL